MNGYLRKQALKNESESFKPTPRIVAQWLPSEAQLLMRRLLNFDYFPDLPCALCTMLTPPREIHDSDSAAYFTRACPIYPVGPADRTGVKFYFSVYSIGVKFTPVTAERISLGCCQHMRALFPWQTPTTGISLPQLYFSPSRRDLDLQFQHKVFSKSSTNASFVELFYVYLCGATRVYSPLEGNPVAPLGSADSLRELLDLVARHPARLAWARAMAGRPGHKGIHPRLKPDFLRSG